MSIKSFGNPNARYKATMSRTGDFRNPIPTYYGDRGIFAAGYGGGSHVNTIDYITISSPGNATDFGDTITGKSGRAACSNSIRGIIAGGSGHHNEIEYITISTPGNGTDFGNLTQGRYAPAGNASSAGRGIFGGGGSTTNIIDYITISSTGNATDFGDLTRNVDEPAGVSNGTRGVFAGGYGPAPSYTAQNTMDYVTIDTTGDASDFGDLSKIWQGIHGCGNLDDRGLMGSGKNGPSNAHTDEIVYITISSTGNSQDFGDLTQARNGAMSCANGIRCTWGGGAYPNSSQNTIDYVTMATTGNAIDFGDLTQARQYTEGCSGDA